MASMTCFRAAVIVLVFLLLCSIHASVHGQRAPRHGKYHRRDIHIGLDAPKARKDLTNEIHRSDDFSVEIKDSFFHQAQAKKLSLSHDSSTTIPSPFLFASFYFFLLFFFFIYFFFFFVFVSISFSSPVL